jgi:hypothetical protein
MAKIHWNETTRDVPRSITVPGIQHDVDFMVRTAEVCGQRRMGMGRVRL